MGFFDKIMGAFGFQSEGSKKKKKVAQIIYLLLIFQLSKIKSIPQK